MPLTPITIVEQGHRSIPIGSVIHKSGLDLLPEVTSGKYVSVRLSADSLDIRASKYIGYIPLNSRYVLHITPKFGISNLLRLLAESKGDSHALSFFERTYRAVFDPDRTLVDFLASCLNQELDTLAREGMWRAYLPKHTVSAFPAGKILPTSTILRTWANGDTERLHFERFELSKDTVSNRLVKYSIWLLCSPLTNYGEIKRETVRSLRNHLRRFQGVKLDHSLGFLAPIERLIQTKAFPRSRPYYARLCKIALYVLRSLGLGILRQGADVSLPSFVIDLEAAFEKYILRILQSQLPQILPDAHVLDGNQEGARELFVDRKGYRMTPDIVIVGEATPLLMADVKYKQIPERGDRSQVITYAVGYGATRSLLICPASGGQRQGLRSLGLVNNSIQVDEYYFNLAADDLSREEHGLAQTVAYLVER